MEIGDKVALHKVAFPDLSKQPEDEFTVVTITDRRNDVPGTFGNGTYEGYRGTDDQGRMFELHWSGSFPDDSMTPCWRWMQVDWTNPCEDGYSLYLGEWFDITQGMALPPKLPDFFKDKGVLGYCEKHKELYSLTGSLAKYGCYHCWSVNHGGKDSRAQLIKQIEEENKTWRGW